MCKQRNKKKKYSFPDKSIQSCVQDLPLGQRMQRARNGLAQRKSTYFGSQVSFIVSKNLRWEICGYWKLTLMHDADQKRTKLKQSRN